MKRGRPKKNSIRVCIKLNPIVYSEFKDRCKNKDLNYSDVIEQLIKDHINMVPKNNI